MAPLIYRQFFEKRPKTVQFSTRGERYHKLTRLFSHRAPLSTQNFSNDWRVQTRQHPRWEHEEEQNLRKFPIAFLSTFNRDNLDKFRNFIISFWVFSTTLLHATHQNLHPLGVHNFISQNHVKFLLIVVNIPDGEGDNSGEGGSKTFTIQARIAISWCLVHKRKNKN